MKKPLTLFLGLLLYSTTPSAKTLVMECFIPNPFGANDRKSLGIYKFNSNAEDNSKDLFTRRVKGNWNGCPNDWDCSKGDDSVIITIPTNGTRLTQVFDFKFLTFTQKGYITNKETNGVREANVEGTCERINL